MTRFLQTILLTCFCQLLAAQAQEAGRYQLLTAQLQTQDGRSQTTVFKMDTATGQTWVYQMNAGTGVGDWIEVGGNPKGSPVASTTPNVRSQTTPIPGTAPGKLNPSEQPATNAAANAVPQPHLMPIATPHPPLSLNSTMQQPTQTQQQQRQQSSERQQQPKSIHLTSPQIGEPVRPKNLVPLRAKIEEYNRIIQWGMANQNGAWIRDKNGEKVFVNPKQINTMVEDAQAKKEDILKQMQDRNFWVNQFEK